ARPAPERVGPSRRRPMPRSRGRAKAARIVAHDALLFAGTVAMAKTHGRRTASSEDLALVSLLPLAFAFVRVHDPAGGSAIESERGTVQGRGATFAFSIPLRTS